MDSIPQQSFDLPFAEVIRLIKGARGVHSGMKRLFGKVGQVMLFPFNLLAGLFFSLIILIANQMLKRKFEAFKAMPLNAWKYQKLRSIYVSADPTDSKDFFTFADVKQHTPLHLMPAFWAMFKFFKTFEEFQVYTEPILKEFDTPGVHGSLFNHIPEKELWSNHIASYKYLV